MGRSRATIIVFGRYLNVCLGDSAGRSSRISIVMVIMCMHEHPGLLNASMCLIQNAVRPVRVVHGRQFSSIWAVAFTIGCYRPDEALGILASLSRKRLLATILSLPSTPHLPSSSQIPITVAPVCRSFHYSRSHRSSVKARVFYDLTSH